MIVRCFICGRLQEDKSEIAGIALCEICNTWVKDRPVRLDGAQAKAKMLIKEHKKKQEGKKK